MSISWYECDIIAQIHHFSFRRLSVATIYGQGEIAESQGKVREKSGNFFFPILWEPWALLLDGGLVKGYPWRIWVIIDTPKAKLT